MEDGMFKSSSVCGPNKIYLYRGGTKEVLDRKRTTVYDKYSIIVELPRRISSSEPELKSNECKWKIGDGRHSYSELPYQEDTIPVEFEINRKLNYRNLIKAKEKAERIDI